MLLLLQMVTSDAARVRGPGGGLCLSGEKADWLNVANGFVPEPTADALTGCGGV